MLFFQSQIQVAKNIQHFLSLARPQKVKRHKVATANVYITKSPRS